MEKLDQRRALIFGSASIGLLIGLFLGFIIVTVQPTFTWDTFWSAVAASATVITAVIAALILFRELPKLRTESASLKVDAWDHVKEQLESKEFTVPNDRVVNAARKAKEVYPSGDHSFILQALKLLDYVGKLIEMGFVDSELVMYSYGEQFGVLEQGYTILEKTQGSQITPLRALYWRGYDLLKEGAKYSKRVYADREEREEAYRKKSRATAAGHD